VDTVENHLFSQVRSLFGQVDGVWVNRGVMGVAGDDAG
jgi:hypothetical protein